MPTPDQAAEALQIPERGPDLVTRCLNDETIAKAIQMVGGGFSASDVAQALGLPWDKEVYEDQVETDLEGKIKVWECKTNRCRQKGAVSTADEAPDCPSCGIVMVFLMAINDADEISHMRRTTLKVKISDPLARTDRNKAPDFAMGDFEDDE